MTSTSKRTSEDIVAPSSDTATVESIKPDTTVENDYDLERNNKSTFPSDDSDDMNYSEDEFEHDAFEEIEKMSRKENLDVTHWKWAVTIAFLATAVVVTVTTYLLLDRAEYNNFVVAYDQFARTLSDSAIEHQKDLRDSIRSLSQSITTYSEAIDAEWPYFYMPRFETLARNFKDLSRAELVGVNNIVRHEEREAYITYTTAHYEDWIKEGHLLAYGNLDKLNTDLSKYNRFISRKGPNGWEEDIDRPSYQVRTTLSPPPRAYGPVTNWNAYLAEPDPLDVAIELGSDLVVGLVRPYRALPLDEHQGLHTGDDLDHPHSFVYYPIHKSIFNGSSEIVGTITAATAWDVSMRNLLPDNVRGIFCVIHNNCNQSYSYRIDGKDAIFEGEGDSHEVKYNAMEVVVDLALHTHPEFESTQGHCMYKMSIYPSGIFEKSYETSAPEVFATIVASAFILVSLIFFVYDVMVHRRNVKLIASAAQTGAIVSELFPDEIRKRLIEQNNDMRRNSRSLTKYLAVDNAAVENDCFTDFNTDPLAELFLETTVLFADIVGFTAWSSQREPSQVFKLLESVFCAFDRIAKRRRVFKVETVGDCYVAVCGLPNPRVDHALAIVKFAGAIMKAMRVVTRKLEIVLGPDTADLALRIGVHSGPVTGGVLRGDRSRFQLFGDTMNTCARMESTSMINRIQISKETARHIVNAGKESLLTKREGKVSAKGKGLMETYWVKHTSQDFSSFGSCSVGDEELDDWNENLLGVELRSKFFENDDHSRLINWNVVMMLRIIKQIVSRRNALTKRTSSVMRKDAGDKDLEKAHMPLDEVKEIISLPKFSSKAARREQNPDDVELPPEVVNQLHNYVRRIATMYKENPFHNFAHASHVVMSVIKLMSRIVAPKEIDVDDEEEDESMNASAGKLSMAESLHDHTYGITSDPLTQFACAFSALIHDVDHTGVPNPQLIKENPELALRYKSRSVAEQNSFDLSWNLLMEDSFADLRRAICTTKAELARFRSLVINSVMATDLGDKELKALRNARWEKAFSKQQEQQDTITDSAADLVKELVLNIKGNQDDNVNRKATIVIEHIIQASDVSHTMQHWHIYRKWNECLFREIYQNFLDGRCTEDPSKMWYNGEIGFFDFYIIPLAKKLKECGVFGIASDEYLTYATMNRQEWEERGQEVVAEMMRNMHMEKNEDEQIC